MCALIALACQSAMDIVRRGMFRCLISFELNHHSVTLSIVDGYSFFITLSFKCVVFINWVNSQFNAQIKREIRQSTCSSLYI